MCENHKYASGAVAAREESSVITEAELKKTPLEDGEYKVENTKTGETFLTQAVNGIVGVVNKMLK